MDWERLFAPHILVRGRDYYDFGAVENMQKTEDGYTAQVEGTDLYDVGIELSRNAVQDMWCTCPYAADGSRCKHMAAVLYALEDEDLLSDTASVSDDALYKAISGMSEEKAKNLLLQLGLADLKVRSKILSLGAGEETGSRQIGWEMQIAALTRRAADLDGFIDYRHAFAYFTALADFLDENVPFLLDNECPMDAFRLICLVCETAAKQDADDSDGGLSMLLGTCEAYWDDAIPAATEEQQREMFQWFTSVPQQGLPDFVEEVLMSIQQRMFRQSEYLHGMLNMLDQMLAAPDLGVYQMEDTVQRRLGIMEELRLPAAELQAFRMKYRMLPAIWQEDFQEQVEHGNAQQAIAMLKERQSLCAGNASELKAISECYLAVYERFEMREAYVQELKAYVLQFRQFTLERIEKLKQVTPEAEWPALRAQLLQADTVSCVRYDLLKEEGMLAELWEALQKTGEAFLLDRYESVLKEAYGPELLRLYLKIYDRKMRTAVDRKMYRSIIQSLKHLRTYSNGRESVQALVAQWTQQYHRRTAMLDELRKAGY